MFTIVDEYNPNCAAPFSLSDRFVKHNGTNRVTIRKFSAEIRMKIGVTKLTQ